MRFLFLSVVLVTLLVSALTAASPAMAHTGYEPKQIRVCKPRAECLEGGGSRWTVLFETYYLQRVLPNEWVCSWNAASVKAGAVAVRTYGWWRVEHPRSSEYDIYGDSNDQVYKPDSANSTCNNRIEATAGTRVEKNGARVFAAYRAETGNPTKDGDRTYLVPVSDPHTTQSTTGPGMCQNGSKWYGDNGHGYSSILTHYYTGVTVQTGAAHYLSGAGCSCGPSGCYRSEYWKDTSDGSTFIRTFAVATCPS